MALGGAIAFTTAQRGYGQTQPFFQGLGDLQGGGSYSFALALSADGSTVVGGSEDQYAYRAYRWTAMSGMVSLGGLPDEAHSRGGARASSADGLVVAVQNIDTSVPSPQSVSCIWTPEGGLVSLGNYPGTTRGSIPFGVSGDGRIIVGMTGISENVNRAFAWTADGGWTELGSLRGPTGSSAANAISLDSSTIVGNSSVSDSEGSSTHAFRWTQASGMVDLGDLYPGITYYSDAFAVSADGSVVVGTTVSTFGLREAFRWTEETGMVALGDLGGFRFASFAYGVSGDGSVVVGSSDTAFIWDARRGMRRLKTVLEDEIGLDLTGWSLYEAVAISADGRTLAGTGSNPAGADEAWIAYLGPACRADFNGDNAVNSQDFFDFLAAFWAGDADFNRDAHTNSSDFFDFLNTFFAPCGE